MENKNYKEIQILQLQRNIDIIQEILDGKIENYTNQPIQSLREAKANCQAKIDELRKSFLANKGGFRGD